jgi:hypothetical protein
MQKSPSDSPYDEQKPIGKIFQDPEDPCFVFVITEYRSWRVDGYILQEILNNHMRGVNNAEVDAPNPFVDESSLEEDWESRKKTRSRFAGEKI